MSSLEQRLQELGRELAFPPEPDLAATRAHAPAGRSRGGGSPSRRRS